MGRKLCICALGSMEQLHVAKLRGTWLWTVVNTGPGSVGSIVKETCKLGVDAREIHVTIESIDNILIVHEKRVALSFEVASSGTDHVIGLGASFAYWCSLTFFSCRTGRLRSFGSDQTARQSFTARVKISAYV